MFFYELECKDAPNCKAVGLTSEFCAIQKAKEMCPTGCKLPNCLGRTSNTGTYNIWLLLVAFVVIKLLN